MKILLALLAAHTVVTVKGFCPLVPGRLETGVTTLCLRDQKLNKDSKWVEQDMKEAGKAELESYDWVAEDIERVGSQGGEGIKDVFQDMTKTGTAHAHPKHKKKDDTLKEKTTWDIARDMKRTGKATDWIAHDIEEMGRPDAHNNKFSTEHWLNNQLDQELNRLEQERKDVKKDMEKTGRLGSDHEQEIRSDMEHTGLAQNPFEALQDFFQGITYKLNEWTDKAFHEQAKIEEEMKETGKASDQSWIKHDLEVTGREGLDHGQPLPKQKTELAEDLTEAIHEQYIATDMVREGRIALTNGGVSFRKEHDRTSLVSEDMKLTGLGGSFSEERIRQDMELAGRAAGPSSMTKNEGNVHGSQYRQELEAFQSMKHAPPKAPVEPVNKPGDLTVTATPKQETGTVDEFDVTVGTTKKEDPIKQTGFVRHLLQKVRHPKTPWKDL